MLLFDGVAMSKNKVKRKRGQSSFGRLTGPLFEFAERVVDRLKASVLNINTEQFLVVKLFHYRGQFLLNSVGGNT